MLDACTVVLFCLLLSSVSLLGRLDSAYRILKPSLSRLDFFNMTFGVRSSDPCDDLLPATSLSKFYVFYQSSCDLSADSLEPVPLSFSWVSGWASHLVAR